MIYSNIATATATSILPGIDIAANANSDSLPVPLIGYIFQTANPTVTLTLNVPRDTGVGVVQIQSLLVINKFDNVYNPATDCCTTQCPANSGVNVNSVPISCVSCTAGLIYNSVTGQCQCAVGMY